ncbi:MAG: helix-turn-helix transcriptional regulator [Pirellulales bacterium]
MEKKLNRVFRDRHLTASEIAADEDVRRKVEAEFPPGKSASIGQTSALTDLLKQSIRKSGQTVDEIARESNVTPQLLAQFLAGESDIRMATADRLAETLGLKVSVE